MDSYTVPAPDLVFTAETEAKRSRFLAVARRVDDEAAAKLFLDRTRKINPDAGHHCWAYVLGPDRRIQRSSDDGEPGGTAGVPILETILKGHHQPPLSDTMVVVSRHFGGVLLGAGGLVRAYSHASATVLSGATTTTRRRWPVVEIRLEAGLAGKMEHRLRAAGHAILDTRYAQDVVHTVAVNPGVDEEAGFLEWCGRQGGSADAAGSTWIDDSTAG